MTTTPDPKTVRETPTAARLAEIHARSNRLNGVPLETSARNYIMRDMIGSIGDVRWLLEQLEQQQAIVERVTGRMREYDRHAVGSVNIRQVLNLLSPTWPDGNYQAAPTGSDRG